MILTADSDRKTNYTATYILCDLISPTLFEVHASNIERGQILHRPVALYLFPLNLTHSMGMLGSMQSLAFFSAEVAFTRSASQLDSRNRSLRPLGSCSRKRLHIDECAIASTTVQSNPLNGSPDNGSIRFIVKDLVSPVLLCFHRKPLSENWSNPVIGSIFGGQNRGTIKRV